MTFSLDSQLKNDGILLGETPDYIVNLVNDSRFPWLVVVPKVANVEEIHELSDIDQQKFSYQSAILGRELMELFKGDKFNVAALGNRVRQLHIHHIVRHKSDDAWPNPVWGNGTAIPYGEVALANRTELLRASLSILKA